MTDEELVELIVKSNKSDLFGVLYDRYSQKVYHKCISMVAELNSAQDITHDIFLKVFVSLDGFSGKSKFSTWLYSVTYNSCIDFLRKRNKLKEQSDDGFDIPQDDSDHLEEELMNIRAERLKKVLELVPVKEKALLLMKYQDGMSVEELCNIYDSKESAMKMKLKRAKARAVALYNEHYGHE